MPYISWVKHTHTWTENKVQILFLNINKGSESREKRRGLTVGYVLFMMNSQARNTCTFAVLNKTSANTNVWQWVYSFQCVNVFVAEWERIHGRWQKCRFLKRIDARWIIWWMTFDKSRHIFMKCQSGDSCFFLLCICSKNRYVFKYTEICVNVCRSLCVSFSFDALHSLV